ncbi:MAG: hypothetical protein ACTSWM_05815, partial [Alphaproteobacteria bacterium]
AHNCDDVQGYFLCRPQPAAQFAQWLCQYADDPATAAYNVQSAWLTDNSLDPRQPQQISLASS